MQFQNIFSWSTTWLFTLFIHKSTFLILIQLHYLLFTLIGNDIGDLRTIANLHSEVRTSIGFKHTLGGILFHIPFSLINTHILQVLGTICLVPLAKKKKGDFFLNFTAFITTTITPIEKKKLEKTWRSSPVFRWRKFTCFLQFLTFFPNLPSSV